MRCRTLLGLLVGACALGLPSPVAGSELFSSSGIGGLGISAIDQTNGAYRKVMDTQHLGWIADDLANDPTPSSPFLWSISSYTNNATDNRLREIDPFENLVVQSIPIVAPTSIWSLAIDPTDGQFYGLGGSNLFRIDATSGMAEIVGDLGAPYGFRDTPLAFGPDGQLYGARSTKFFKIDKTSGTVSDVKGVPTTIYGIAFRPEDGTLFVISYDSNYRLYTMDPSSAALTLVGNSLGRPVGLAFVDTTAPIAGDYNHNGVVDAADYAIWRDTLGSSSNLLANGDGNASIGAGDYSVWASHFGNGGGGASGAAAVAEPSSLILLLTALALLRGARLR